MEKQLVSKISLKSCVLFVGAPSLGVKSASVAGKRSSIAHSAVVGVASPGISLPPSLPAHSLTQQKGALLMRAALLMCLQ